VEEWVRILDMTVQRLAKLRHLALDLDGTLYLGKKLLDCTLPFLHLLAERGIGRTFFTNNSSRSTQQYVHKLNALGIEATQAYVYRSTASTIDFLRRDHSDVKRIFVLGTPGLAAEFVEAGFEVVAKSSSRSEPDAVIVGFDTTLTYPRVCEAAYWLSKGKLFIATHCDLTCPTDEQTILPDCGAICRMLSAAVAREPDAVLGKPHPIMLEGVIRRHHLMPDELAVVGDRLYTDVAMAHSAGAMGILVLSGETTREQVEGAKEKPDLVVSDVGELARMLAQRDALSVATELTPSSRYSGERAGERGEKLSTTDCGL
jgi:NagD protein